MTCHRVDPSYVATQLHFADLLERYSSPLCVLNLIKQKEKREREVIVGKYVEILWNQSSGVEKYLDHQ